MSWVRGGYCCRCGQCCVGDPHHPSMAGRVAAVQGYCPLFEWRNMPEGPGFCRGHLGAVPSGQENAYYMAGCRTWPDDPAQIADKPGCTYNFTWQDD